MKIFIISFISIIILGFSLLLIQPIRNKAENALWDWVTYQLDKEEAERLEKAKNHQVVRGKDTAFIWNEHYEIWNQSGDKLFGIEIEDASSSILGKVSLFDVYKNQFYVISKDGYAVVDKDNYCKVFLLTDRNKIESKYIKYLSSYFDFSKEEQNHFRDMAEK